MRSLPGPAASPESRVVAARYRRLLRRQANLVSGGMLLLIVLLYYSPAVWELVERIGPAYADLPCVLTRGVNLALTVLAFTLPCALIALGSGIPGKRLFPVRLPAPGLFIPAVFFCLGLSVIGGAASQLLSQVIRQLFGLAPYMPVSALPDTPPETVIHVLSYAVVPALMEELLFRGAVLHSLRRFGDGFALVISSLLFAFAHGNLVQAPNALLVGLAFGYFVLRTGTVLTGILLHFINNFLILAVELLEPVSRLPVSLDVCMLVAYTALGLVGWVWLRVRHGGVPVLRPSRAPIGEGRKVLLFFTSLLSIVYLIAILRIFSFYLR